MKDKIYIIHVYDEELEDDYYISCHSIEDYIKTIEHLKEYDYIKITAKLYQAIGEEYLIINKIKENKK